eukprot:5630450-Alexandrium_andersonii.AAC.1
MFFPSIIGPSTHRVPVPLTVREPFSPALPNRLDRGRGTQIEYSSAQADLCRVRTEKATTCLEMSPCLQKSTCTEGAR